MKSLLLVSLSACMVQSNPPPSNYPPSRPPPPQEQAVPELASIKVINAREGRSTSPRSDIQVTTTVYERTPTIIDGGASLGPYVLSRPAKVWLAGDATGRQGWRIDNFVLVEVFDPRGGLIASGVVGNIETDRVMLGSTAVRQFGENKFEQVPVDITPLVPAGQPFTLRVTALDYGGAAYVSDAWLAVTNR